MKQRKRVNSVIRISAAILCLVLFLIGIRLFANTRKPVTDEQAPFDSIQFVMRPTPTVVSDTVRTRLPFAVDSLAITEDPDRSLDAFFSALDRLSMGVDTVVSIVHLGDSHLQAGFLSGRTMRLMQQQYGNAGRGWIAPLKITRTNEPDDYFIKSVVKDWTTGRCIQPVPKTPIGPGGMGIHTISHFANFDIVIAPNNGAGYDFNKVIVYRGEQSMPMVVGGSFRDSVTVGRSHQAILPGLTTDTLYIHCLTDSLQLQSTRRKEGTDSLLDASSFNNLYYGFSLTNGAPGILYHTIGINGAMFVNYTDDSYVRKLALFKPSLLIISLGTNETFGRNFSSAEFSGQVKALLSLVKKYMPQTSILLTTPPECYRRVWVNKKRTYIRNENTERAAKAIVKVAEEEKVACWDMFVATGGKGSSAKWFSGKWMGRDRVHFSKDGYTEQGILLFKAIMNLKIEREKELSLTDR